MICSFGKGTGKVSRFFEEVEQRLPWEGSAFDLGSTKASLAPRDFENYDVAVESENLPH